MLKISVDPEADDLGFKIVENDRGGWMFGDRIGGLDGQTSCVHLVGFGGENILTIHIMGMQDGSHSVAVVHNCVDNPIVVKQGGCARPGEGRTVADQLNTCINGLIAEVCDYPEVL